MKPLLNTVANEIRALIEVRVIGVSREEAEILRKIFQLSMTRQRRYRWYEKHSEAAAEIVILGPLANADDSDLHGIPKVTLGEQKVPSISAYHIQTPLLGVRVLRILDQVHISEHPSSGTATIQIDNLVD